MTAVDENVVRVAEGLSETERKAIERNVSIWGERHDYEWMRWAPTGRELRAKGLIEFIGPVSSLTRLTLLGLAVKAHLTKGNEHGG